MFGSHLFGSGYFGQGPGGIVETTIEPRYIELDGTVEDIELIGTVADYIDLPGSDTPDYGR